MKKKFVATLLTSIFVLGGVATPSFAKGLDVSNTKVMYAVAGTTGIANGGIEAGRMTINNALRNNISFYSIGSHQFSKFTFGESFYKVEDQWDINLSEITWGNGWYEEAAEVYLVNPMITGNKKYEGNDIELEGNNDNLYFAGVAYNKVVDVKKHAKEYKEYESKKISGREFGEKEVISNGNLTNIGINLPGEVISAEGIVLVDITGKVHSDIYNNDKYLNDDGFDLASIKVYGQNSIDNDDSSTGDDDSNSGNDSSNGDNSVDDGNNDIEVNEKITFTDKFKVNWGQAKKEDGQKRDIVLNGEKIGECTVKYISAKGNGQIIVTYRINEEINEKINIEEKLLKISKNGEEHVENFNEVITLSDDGINGNPALDIIIDFTITK